MTSVQVRVLVVCVIATNVGLGLTYGTLGPLVAATKQTFHINPATAMLSMSFSSLAVSIFGPPFGLWMQRASIRMTMIVGAVAGGVAFLGQAYVSSFTWALALYVLGSAGALLTSILGPIALASRWFPENRGKAIAFVSIPVMTALAPLIILAARPLGRASTMQGMAAAMFLLVPLLLLLPREVAAASKGAPGAAARPRARAGGLTWAALCLNPYFWLICMAIGILLSSGSVFLMHAIPFGMERGLTLAQASGLITAATAAGVCGIMVVGAMADRFGPPLTIAMIAVAEALAWWGMLHTHGLMLFVLAAVMGVGINSTITLQGAAMAALFGAENVPSAMGLSQFVKFPLTFGAPPVVALLMSASHGYRIPILVVSASIGAAALAALVTTQARKAPVPALVGGEA